MATLILEQRIRYGYSAPVTDLRQRLMTVPPARHGAQTRRRWRVEVNEVDASTTRAGTDPFGNTLVHATVPHVERCVEFAVEVTVELGADLDAPGRPHPVRADERYRHPTALTSSDAAISDLAERGRRGDAGAICAGVHRALDYEWGVTEVATTASEALAGGRGVCQDYAHVMLAACREAGLAARYVSGHLRGEGGSHAWVEVLHAAGGRAGTWIAEGWDPTHDRRITADYLVVATGRDYRDVAPLSGTYEGDGVRTTLRVDKRLAVA